MKRLRRRLPDAKPRDYIGAANASTALALQEPAGWRSRMRWPRVVQAAIWSKPAQLEPRWGTRPACPQPVAQHDWPGARGSGLQRLDRGGSPAWRGPAPRPRRRFGCCACAACARCAEASAQGGKRPGEAGSRRARMRLRVSAHRYWSDRPRRRCPVRHPVTQ